MYVGEPGENDALVQRDAGHFGERAVPRAGNRGHGWRIGDRACGQQVTLQLNNPLVTANPFFCFEATGGDCSPTDYKYIKQKEKSCAPKVLRNKGKKRNEANLGY